MSVMTDENGQTEEDHTEQHTTDEEMTSHQYTQQSVEQREPTFTSEEEGGMKSSLRESTRSTSTTGGGEGVMTYNHLGIGFSSPGVSALMTPTPAYHQPRPLRARFNVPEERSQESTTPPLPEVEEEDEAGEMELEDSEEGEQTGEVTYRPEFQQQQQQVNETFDPRDDPTTPYASHKKSFLLSVINSTARPRMKYPTPHPHRAGVGITRNDFLQTPGPGLVPATPGTVGGIGFQNSFAGVTPRPRGGIRPGILGRRVSHPLTQTFTPAHPSTTTTTTTTTESSAASVSGSEHDPVSLPSPAALPSSIMPGSPYIETNLPSFISTTSSQDLTTHARANASFDPVIGLGERGGVGVGRFNAPKLNNYLHGLNRKLQEENEGLVERLRIYEEKYGAVGRDGKPLGKASDTEGSERGGSSSPMNSPQLSSRGMSEPQQRRRSGGGRRVSAGPLGLVDVVEDEAEIWGEEKAALEEQIQDLRDQLDRALDTHRSTLSALDKEKNERARDKERWKERMGEVERGVEGIVRDLEEKQREAEEKAKESELEKLRVVKEVERRLAEVVVERDVLAERVEKAESALESGEDLGKEVNTANERVARIMGELKNANLRIREMEGEMESAEGKIDALEAELKEDQRTISRMEEKLRGKDRELGDVVPKLERLEHEFGETQNELEYTKAYVTELEEQAESAVERIQALDHQLVASEGKLEAMMEELDQEREKANHLEEETERAAEVAKQMEEALEEAENKMLTDEQELATLKSKVTALERELDKSRSVIDPSHLGDTQAQEDIEALEDELAQAHKEIAKLTTLVNQSPARKAIDKAKDSKIEILEKEREDLLERLRTLKNASMAFNTPSKIMNGSGISPMHRHVMAMSFKSPKTPGGPLRDVSASPRLHHTGG